MSAKQAYKALVPNLAECLSALEEDEYLIVARKHTNVYVQFAGQGWHGMRAEAVSNAHILPLTTLLSVKQYEAMLRLGWQRPTSLPEESDSDGRTPRDVDGSCNFFVDVPRDGVTPRNHATAAGERAPSAVHAQEGLLQEVVGHRSRLGHT